jgi:hypothetical protein
VEAEETAESKELESDEEKPPRSFASQRSP